MAGQITQNEEELQLKHIFSLALLTLGAVALLLVAIACGIDSTPTAPPQPLPDCTTQDDSSMKEKILITTPESLHDDVERARAIRHKYEDLFWRRSNVWGVGIGEFRDENGEWAGGPWGFVISVTEKVDQNTLPPEDRIPDCLEGVPVQIIEETTPYLE